MDKDKIEQSDFASFHYTVFALIEAVETGKVTKVKRLLKNSAFPEGIEKAASLALGNMDPLRNPDIATNLWWEHHESHKPDEQRPSKRKLRGAWQRISRCIYQLLDAGADPKATDQDGITALNNLGSYELPGVFDRLLQLGADPNKGAFGSYPLHEAADIERRVQLLLDHGADPNRENEWGDTPLMVASRYSSLNIVQKLLNAGADVNHRNNNGNTPLMLASCNNIQVLIDVGADVNNRNNGGETPLIMASEGQSLCEIQKLIDAGAEINCMDNMGRTALMRTLRMHVDPPSTIIYDWYRECKIKHNPRTKSLCITCFLISAGAKYDEADINGFFTTDYALMAHLNGVELPQELKANQVHLKLCRAATDNNSPELNSLAVSENIPKRILTLALHLAATRGYAQCCAALLKHGADANGVDLLDNHPVESAAVGLHIAVVLLLIAEGVTLEGLNRALLATCMAQSHWWPDEDKKSFMDRRLVLARWLLEQGANPNYRYSYNHDPPLKQAMAIYDDCNLAILLLEYGADPAARDEWGETLVESAHTDRMKAILQEWSSKA